MSKIQVYIIDYGTQDYQDGKKIREDVLRKPLGLSLSAEDLNNENRQIHFCAFDGEKVVGTLILVPQANKYKIRQVAVAPKYQKLGVGQKLLESCERYARKVNMSEIYCSARVSAEDFYKKNKFNVDGDVFVEHTIPHVKMVKKLV